MLHKHEIPILEFDDDEKAVLSPDHEGLSPLPQKAVFAFLYDEVDRYALKNGARIVSSFISATKDYPVYQMNFEGEEICLMQAPVGAPASTQILDWLISYGVQKIIAVGSCGTLRKIEENRFLIPTKALRDEGTSYHYAPPSRFIEPDLQAVEAIKQGLNSFGYPFEEVITWSTDGFFRETKEKVEYRKNEGCSVVEMECSALCACAKMRSATFGQILYTADSLADILNHDARDWGEKSRKIALEIALKSLHFL